MIGKLKYLILGSCLMLLGACNSSSPISPRERSDFNADWRFHLETDYKLHNLVLPTMTGGY